MSIKDVSKISIETVVTWFTRILMLFLTVIGFLIQQSLRDQEIANVKRDEFNIKMDNRVAIIEGTLISTVQQTAIQTERNRELLDKIISNRYSKEDAAKDREITDLKLELLRQVIKKN